MSTPDKSVGPEDLEEKICNILAAKEAELLAILVPDRDIDVEPTITIQESQELLIKSQKNLPAAQESQQHAREIFECKTPIMRDAISDMADYKESQLYYRFLTEDPNFIGVQDTIIKNAEAAEDVVNSLCDLIGLFRYRLDAENDPHTIMAILKKYCSIKEGAPVEGAFAQGVEMLQGICFCKHGELPKDHKKRCRVLERIIQESENARNLYFDWSRGHLKAEVRQRGIAIPKPKRRTKTVLTTLLQQSDPQAPFRLMDLPSEVRLRIYESILVDGTKQDVSPRCPAEVYLPGLLRTSHQIRDEAMPVFHGAKGFRFLLPYLCDGQDSKQWFDGLDKKWLHEIGPDNVKNSRHVSFRSISAWFEEYDLHIDLASRSISTWLIPVGREDLPCLCQHQEKRDLMQWREKLINEIPTEKQQEFLRNIDKCMATANKAIQDFQALCGEGYKVEPTIAGLAILAKAAYFILDSHATWAFSYMADMMNLEKFGLVGESNDDDDDDDGDGDDEKEDEEGDEEDED